MPKDKAHRDRQERGDELLVIAEALRRQTKCCPDPSPLKTAADECKTGTGARPGQWGYRLADLKIEFPKPQQTKPTSVANQLTVTIDVELLAQSGYQHDPFVKLNVCMVALSPASPGNSQRQFSWHLDRHICNHGQIQVPAKGAHVHPLYHFQLGGFGLNLSDAGYGDLLVMPCPRLAYLPLDGVLAIDFALSQFAPNEWHACRDDSSYAKTVARAHQRLWRPHIETLHGSLTLNAAAFDKHAVRTLLPDFSREQFA